MIFSHYLTNLNVSLQLKYGKIMSLKRVYFVLLIVAFGELTSCSDYQKMIKKGSEATNEEKKNAAIQYYENEDYLKSITLLEDIMPYYSLTTEGENLNFIYCMANYKTDDYYLSGYYFKRFIRKYPKSNLTEEALFLSAICSVKNSPEYSLDQTETYNALDQLQIFIDEYPSSSRIDSCNQIMDNLRAKLELKQFEYAKLYYKTENYNSAVVALEQTLQKFPESTFKEEIHYLLVLSNFKLAINSIDEKKMERLNNTLKSYRTFASLFPDSNKLDELNGIKKQTEKAIEEFKEIN